MRRFATVCCCYDFSEKYYNKSGMERLCVAKTKVCGDLRMLFMQQYQGVLQRIHPTVSLNCTISPDVRQFATVVVAMIFREKLQRKCDGTALCSKNESLW